jgi:hypothetical protein
MGLAFYGDNGKRIPSTTSPPNHGGPMLGMPFFPRDASGQRLLWTPDIGGLPFWRCAALGRSSITNLIANPSFDTNTTGWTGVTRLPYGGLWGVPGCGIIADLTTASADLDANYTYNKGSALGSKSFTFGCWGRIATDDSSIVAIAKTRLKLRIEDTGGNIRRTAAYRQLRVEDGWVSMVLTTELVAWSGNILNVGFEFETAAGTSYVQVAIDGAYLVEEVDEESAHGHAYPISTAGVQWPLVNIPFSIREGFLSCFFFPATSPWVADYAGTFQSTVFMTQQTLMQFGSTLGFQPIVAMRRINSGVGGYQFIAVIGTAVGADPGISLDLLGWPQCVLHVVLGWLNGKACLAIKGYFDPADYGLTSNVAGSDINVDYGQLTDVPSNNSFYLGGNTTRFCGWAWDFNLGSRGLNSSEALGILAHGAGPYTGTVAWAPLESGTQLRLVDAVSFHPGGPLALARSSYAPQSGLVNISGGGSPAGDLSRSTTENVRDTFGIVGKRRDVQQSLRAVSQLGRILEHTHRTNEQSAKYRSTVLWSFSAEQVPHLVLKTFPAPRRLQSQLIWGNVAIDPRLTSPAGQKGQMWGTLEFERWGFWEGPQTQLPLQKNHAATPALTYTTENFNNVGSTTDSNYFEVPEGVIEGDLESPCIVYLANPVGTIGSRYRIARRSRGIPGDVSLIFEAEAAGNSFPQGTGATVVSANQSGGNVRSLTDLASGNTFDAIQFQLLASGTAIPDWFYGEYRALVWVRDSVGLVGTVRFRARVQTGSFLGAWSQWITPAAVPSTGGYMPVDLGLFKVPEFVVPIVQNPSQQISLLLQVNRISGATTTLNFDCLMLLPADENYVQTDRNLSDVATGAGTLLISAMPGEEQALMLDGSGNVQDISLLRTRGLFVQPWRKNRLWLLVDTFNTGIFQTNPDSGSTVSLYYRPRHLLMPSFEGGGGAAWD